MGIYSLGQCSGYIIMLVTTCMRLFLTLMLQLSYLAVCGQSKGKFSLILYSQPELTFHKNDYAFRWSEKHNKVTINAGFTGTVQYSPAKRFFIETGIGYISRKLNTRVFLNQTALPPPRQSFTQELVTTRSVSFRTIHLPFIAGYRCMLRDKTSLSLNAGFAGNYLLNTYYEVDAKKYQGRYRKNYWQGYSLSVGAGADHAISKKFILAGRLAYTAVNTMKADDYLFSQDEYRIALPHKYLNLSIGIKLPF